MPHVPTCPATVPTLDHLPTTRRLCQLLTTHPDVSENQAHALLRTLTQALDNVTLRELKIEHQKRA